MEKLTEILKEEKIDWVEKIDETNLGGIKHKFYYVNQEVDDTKSINIERAIDSNYRKLIKGSLEIKGKGIQEIESNTFIKEKRNGGALFLEGIVSYIKAKENIVDNYFEKREAPYITLIYAKEKSEATVKARKFILKLQNYVSSECN